MPDGMKEWFARLVQVIVQHLGDWGERANDAQADALWRSCSETESDLEVWNPATELQKIDRLRRLLGELHIAIDELHPKVYEGIRLSAVQELIGGKADAHELLGLLHDPIKTLSAALVSGDVTAKRGTAVRSDFNWEAVSVMNECRRAWELRKGKRAPRALNPASPFGSFIADVFDVMRIDVDPQSAMNAWRRVQSGRKVDI